MNKILSFFKSLPHLILRALDIVHELVPQEVLQHAEDLVRQAADNALFNNAQRREWVVEELLKAFPILPERAARMAVELALSLVKKKADEAIDKIA